MMDEHLSRTGTNKKTYVGRLVRHESYESDLHVEG
jgi:hypothetical protein